MPRDATPEEIERLDAFAALRDGPPDFAALFGNAGPVELEIGCGKGRFICRSALTRPHVNFLGVERAMKFFRRTAGAVAAAGVSNVRLLSVDAGVVVRKFLLPAAVAAVHLYYSDPWPKRRHARRRVVSGDFPAALARILRPGGHFNFQTDVDWYFRDVLALLAATPELEVVRSGEVPRDADPSATPGTHWEVKSRKAGLSAWRIEARRRG